MEGFILIISLAFSTAFCSHLPSCKHIVSSSAAAVLRLSALKVPGSNCYHDTSKGEIELKSLLLSLLLIYVWAFAALSSLERERSRKRQFQISA